jgi:hypothetical protein
MGGGHEGRGTSGRPDFGAVPIGTPTLAGPATLATLLVLVDDFGWIITSAAFLLNLLLAWRLFRRAGRLTRFFGRNGLRAASKVTSLMQRRTVSGTLLVLVTPCRGRSGRSNRSAVEGLSSSSWVRSSSEGI